MDINPKKEILRNFSPWPCKIKKIDMNQNIISRPVYEDEHGYIEEKIYLKAFIWMSKIDNQHGKILISQKRGFSRKLRTVFQSDPIYSEEISKWKTMSEIIENK